MKIKLVLVMILVLMVTTIPGFMASGTEYTEQAEILKDLELFSGTNSGFELERAPKRIEAAAMLVKFLGAEQEANLKKYAHPFTDVPTWANNLVGYMYKNGLTTGIGNNLFGSNNLSSARDYTVFVLKALGYNAADFNYSDTMNFAVKMGLITVNDKLLLEARKFTRGEMVFLSYSSLFTDLKTGTMTLGEKLGKSNIEVVKGVGIPTNNIMEAALKQNGVKEITSGFVYTFTDVLAVYPLKLELSKILDAPYYYGVGGFPAGTSSIEAAYSLYYNGNAGAEELGYNGISSLAKINEKSAVFVSVYNKDFKLLGYHKITTSDLNNRSDLFKTVTVNLAEPTSEALNSGHFTVNYYINGVLDPASALSEGKSGYRINDQGEIDSIVLYDIFFIPDIGMEIKVVSKVPGVTVKSFDFK